MTTDNAGAARSARESDRHGEVGLNVKYDAACVDHQIHLLVIYISYSRQLNYDILNFYKFWCWGGGGVLHKYTNLSHF